MTRAVGRRRLVCYHEAGHAVVRWWPGHPADDAAIHDGEPARDAWALRWPPTPEEIRSGFLPQREPRSAPER